MMKILLKLTISKECRLGRMNTRNSEEQILKGLTKLPRLIKVRHKLNQMSSHSAQLKGEVVALQNPLTELIETQAELDKFCREENDAFAAAKLEIKGGDQADHHRKGEKCREKKL